MTEWSCYLADESATVAAGKALGQVLAECADGLSLHLAGDLGAGKTTFTRGVLNSFGHSGAVKSPTYTLVEEYQLPTRTLHHFDLYRLGDPEELEYMGIRDYFTAADICLIEWPVRGEGVLPPADVLITLKVQEPGRIVKLESGTERGSRLVQQLAQLAMRAPQFEQQQD
ncbi:tRNA (adenosine(37)-N6)-threonylcarbamoyltransferase complex ATPase subunit type 1 TsaE [Gilvimarinus sp. SDUM040013]|uniref:tRNA threonylcarbamoyladenosine biosynthesis protein TsaE n=1 Tax=Gilvimarinus gilvus TaxID=3058038 RepID=A0ABU4RXN8_9GAMM|nr:tRNA (adenosine(37)-N6)-threonylcarbamoyltransferase complex ATPase subunit type 1 TsaE [Gilvimarinus sp. SDUM040013]MDO3387302.1 tRNA (adenosine(37)-N6)-threonylcarbamoyltransferase complex ATPase subunit type 1 TsaE [Gilvimarinus sp. SDUM040013]MDX6848991.1 tRNA (adenosine(37)-N6)-threonylcarbamoyltransferase complex ATPase subunit type 1 TsaE [Gilvimarinus sp. SDUM040013]